MSFADPLLGRQLGDYRVMDILGRGGMARVYRGYDEKLDRYAAVKVIDAVLITNENQEEYRQRFQREARAIARLRHPNIVGVYQFGEFENLYYMAMVFIEGRDLGQILKDDAVPRLTFAQTLRIVHDIAGALDYAHAGGVIHRDVKPSNIMVMADGHAILTDFGLALSVPEGSIGNTFGSAHYIAPEQAISSAQAVPQSDLYALGVVLFQMLTGKVPFDDPSAMSVALKHLSDPPPSLRNLNPAISEAVETVVFKALEKSPTDRYHSGEAFARALETALGISTINPPNMPPLPVSAEGQISKPGSSSTLLYPPDKGSTPNRASDPSPPTPLMPIIPPFILTVPSEPTRPLTGTPDAPRRTSDLLASVKARQAGEIPPAPISATASPQVQDNIPTTPQSSVMRPVAPTPIPQAQRPRQAAIIAAVAAVIVLALTAAVLRNRPNESGTSIAALIETVTPSEAAALTTDEAALATSTVRPRPPTLIPTVVNAPIAAITDETTAEIAPLETLATAPSLEATNDPEETATENGTVSPERTPTPSRTRSSRTRTMPPNTSEAVMETLSPTRTPRSTVTPTVVSAETTPETGASAEVTSQAPGGVELRYNAETVVLFNASNETVDVSRLEFVQITPTGVRLNFFSDSWAGEGRPPYALRAGDCYQIWRVEQTRVLPIPDYCNNRQSWRSVNTPRWFWLNGNSEQTFIVKRNDQILATCPVNEGVCTIASEDL